MMAVGWQQEKRHPRNDGRQRAVEGGQVEEVDEDVRVYLEAQDGKLQVFRCPECEVRIAQEADVCLRPSLDRGLLAATFTRTFNMVQIEGSVCCCRCGVYLFPFDKKDPALLTLPLLWKGKRVFKKTALRCVIVLDVGEFPIHFVVPDPQIKDTPEYLQKQAEHREKLVTRSLHVEQKLLSMYPDRDVEVKVLVHYTHPAHVKIEPDWKEKTKLEYYRSLYQDLGATFTVMPFLETEETLAALDVQDLSVMLLCQFDKGNVLEWTEFNAHYRERCLMGLWMLSGGNMLFGNWGNPQLYGDQVLDPYTIDFEEYAAMFEHDPDGVTTNEQPAFSQLMRQGQWLGYWKSKINGEHTDDPPDIIYDKIKAAWDYRFLYPRWLFLRDFPASQFESPTRGRGKHRSYSLDARDKVVPHFRPMPLETDKEEPKGLFDACTVS